VEVWINPPTTRASEETSGLAATRAVSLTTRDPRNDSRLTVPTFAGPAVWRLRHEASPVPVREPARVKLLPGLGDALGRDLWRVRQRLTGRVPVLQQVRYSSKR
jgi:hypothetical protein